MALQVTDFKHGSVWPIMLVSYETLRKFADGLAGFCDVLICDEGHRQALPLCLAGLSCDSSQLHKACLVPVQDLMPAQCV